MTDGKREDADGSGRAPEEKRNFKMRFGTDLKYHFEDPELRRRCGDTGAFEWYEPDWDGMLFRGSPVDW